MQESVGSTLIRAVTGMRKFEDRMGIPSRCLVGLYDAVLSRCDWEYRFVVAEMHQLFMTDINCWMYHDRWMNYPIDTELAMRWSYKPTDEQKKLLRDPEYRPLSRIRDEQIRGEMNRVRDDFHRYQPDIMGKLNRL
jgi:hypothetical protein